MSIYTESDPFAEQHDLTRRIENLEKALEDIAAEVGKLRTEVAQKERPAVAAPNKEAPTRTPPTGQIHIMADDIVLQLGDISSQMNDVFSIAAKLRKALDKLSSSTKP